MADYCQIPIRNRVGVFTVVDPETYEWANKLKWHMDREGYVHGSFQTEVPGRWTKRFLHRLIMDPPSTLQIDHINHVKHDNRRENLRIVTREQNNANRRHQNGGILEKAGRWISYFNIGRKQIHIGHFDSEVEARVARELFISKLLRAASEIKKGSSNG